MAKPKPKTSKPPVSAPASAPVSVSVSEAEDRGEVTKDLKKPDEPDDETQAKIDDAISRGDWAEVTRLRYGDQPNPNKPVKAGDPVLPPAKE
ncbi:MAG: hypothetical protein PHO67_08830 [Candidatus Omnitrophica bacterium]|nr:hypothetical protein [Candidatus Omnitrophota bacterium]